MNHKTASISTKYLQLAIFEESHLRDEKGGNIVFSVLHIQNSAFALFYVVPFTNSCGEILFGWLRLANIYGHNPYTLQPNLQSSITHKDWKTKTRIS